MRLSHPITIIAVLLVAAFAGCIGDGDTDTLDDPTPGDGPAPTEETGSVAGEVMTPSLEEVSGATVAARDETGEIVSTTTTDEEGLFTLNGLAPGTYRIQVSALCCRAAAQNVAVTANEVTEVAFQVEELTDQDLQTPDHVHEEWEGFVSCGLGSAVGSLAACSVLEDPNDDFLREFTLKPGLTELVVGITWTPTGEVSGSDLWVLVEDQGCAALCEAERTYADVEGTPDIVIRITDGPSPDLAFSNITKERIMQMRVFAGGDANLMYQQSFQVHWHAFYWQNAPEGFSPFPDT